MKMGLLGKKIGMTQVYKDNGKLVPITVIEAGPCPVIHIKKKETDGYESIQLGFDDKRASAVNTPDAGRFKKTGVNPKKFVRELRLKDISSYRVGQEVDVDIFAPGDFVDVTGTSIGRGFQGGVKRWGWSGGDSGHGSMFHRAPGSIESGPRLTRVTKGHHLPGHMGNDTITILNLEIVKVDKEKHLLAVKGAIPGAKNSYLVIRESERLPKGSLAAQRRLVPPPPPKKKKEGAWKKDAAKKAAAPAKPAAGGKK